jgi:hypothetical protein
LVLAPKLQGHGTCKCSSQLHHFCNQRIEDELYCCSGQATAISHCAAGKSNWRGLSAESPLRSIPALLDILRRPLTHNRDTTNRGGDSGMGTKNMGSMEAARTVDNNAVDNNGSSQRRLQSPAWPKCSRRTRRGKNSLPLPCARGH